MAVDVSSATSVSIFSPLPLLLAFSAGLRRPQRVSVAGHFELLVDAVSSYVADIAATGAATRPAVEKNL